jgi:glutathione-specific gamma-glutamylcyclotransferase
MWVFGYGSLMWDGWEATRRCVRRTRADLSGYRRVFNKASVRNWGTKEFPGPTLNLIESDSAHCQGMAFEFHDECEHKIATYLAKREGRGFSLRPLPVHLEAEGEIAALVPVYEGNNLIHADSVEQIADMVLRASGKDGKCINYVKGIAEKLHHLGVDDPAVNELWQALVLRCENRRVS